MLHPYLQIVYLIDFAIKEFKCDPAGGSCGLNESVLHERLSASTQRGSERGETPGGRQTRIAKALLALKPNSYHLKLPLPTWSSEDHIISCYLKLVGCPELKIDDTLL